MLQIGHREIERGIVVITLTGKIMLGSESQRIETLLDELIAKGHRLFVFDMAQVTHLDSTGIGRFISCFNKVLSARGKMCIAAASGVVRNGFKVTRLDTVFRFCEDLETASRTLS